MKEKTFNLVLSLWVALGLGLAIFLGFYAYQKLQNEYAASKKLTIATVETLTQNNWDLNSLTKTSTADFKKWLSTPEGLELATNLKLLKSNHSIKFIKTLGLRDFYSYHDSSQTRIFQMSSLIALKDGDHKVNIEFISTNNKELELNKFYFYQFESKDYTLVRNMLTDMIQQNWNLEAWKKYSTSEIKKILADMKIASLMFSYSARISGVTAESPILIIDRNLKDGQQSLKVLIKGTIGNITMSLQKNKNDYKISTFKMSIV